MGSWGPTAERVCMKSGPKTYEYCSKLFTILPHMKRRQYHKAIAGRPDVSGYRVRKYCGVELLSGCYNAAKTKQRQVFRNST